MTRTLESVAVGNLLTMARACAAARRVKLITISRLCHGDPPVLDRLARGQGSITLRKFDEAMTWLHDEKNWPQGTSPPTLWEPWLGDPPPSSRSWAARGSTASASPMARSRGRKRSSASDLPAR